MNDFIPASIANGLFNVSGLQSGNAGRIAGIIGNKAAGDLKALKGHDTDRVAAGEASFHLPDASGKQAFALAQGGAGAVIDNEAAHGLQGSGNPALP